MKTKLLTILTGLFFLVSAISVQADTVYKSKAETKRIPRGTKFQIQLQEPVSTRTSQVDDYFSAILLNDEKTQTNVILPAGSLIRGSISKITPARRLSRGAVLYLDFDHIVTPRGRQMPLDMAVYATMKTTYDGGLYEKMGYGEALQDNWDKTKDITTNSVDFALDANVPTAVKFVTTPFCALGGAIGGGAYLIGDSIADLFKKGADVTFNQGDILTVVLTNAIDVPVN
ncbi:hypothetical protein IJ818_06685 [bacterium]|nr:hypothetical protein [bacterium]